MGLQNIHFILQWYPPNSCVTLERCASLSSILVLLLKKVIASLNTFRFHYQVFGTQTHWLLPKTLRILSYKKKSSLKITHSSSHFLQLFISSTSSLSFSLDLLTMNVCRISSALSSELKQIASCSQVTHHSLTTWSDSLLPFSLNSETYLRSFLPSAGVSISTS